MNGKFRLLIWFYLFFLGITLAGMIVGITAFFSTITIYATILFALLFLIRILTKFGLPGYSATNLKVLVFSVTSTLCMVDLALRYVVPSDAYLNYRERNGNWFCDSNTLRDKFNFVNKFFLPPHFSGYIIAHKPGINRLVKKKEYCYEHRINNEGLRNEIVLVEKKPNEVRLMAFGDSYTEGDGAPQDSTWPVLLNDLLRKKSADTIYRVINAGVDGSDPFYEVSLLKGRMLKYRPDVVMMAINVSDIYDVMARGGNERFKPDSMIVFKPSPWWEPVYNSSMIFRIIMSNLLGYDVALRKKSEQPKERKDALAKLQEPIHEFIDLSEKYKFKPVIIFNPTLSELEHHEFPFSSALLSLDSNQNVIVIDLYKEMGIFSDTGGHDMSKYFWPKDFHNNSQGYFLWSNIVFKQLKEKAVI